MVGKSISKWKIYTMSESILEQDLASSLLLVTIPMIEDLLIQAGSVSVKKPKRRKLI